MFGKRREDEPDEDPPADGDAGPFHHQEPAGHFLILRSDNYKAAYKVWLEIFGPGSDLAKEAEKQRARWRKP